MKKLVIVFLSSFFLLSNVAFAQEDQDLRIETQVDHVASGVEKLREKISLFFRFDKESKVDFYLYLAEKRLAELSYSIGDNKLDLVEPTASRYATYIGTMAEYAGANSVTSKKDDIVKMLERHRWIITKLQENFEYDSGWWLAIQHDINNTLIFEEKIKGI